jgi:hypothetical protein
MEDGTEQVLRYGSHTLNKMEKRYMTTKQALLAAVYFVKFYKHFLYGRPFTHFFTLAQKPKKSRGPGSEVAGITAGF